MPEAAAAEGPGRRARALLPWLVAGALGCAGGALLAVLPAARPSLCPSRALLGLPCPGCGMTRALAALLRGDFAAAFAFHPWAFALAAQAALGWVAWGVSLGNDEARRRLARGAGPLLLANLTALVALWLGRLATGSLP